jgi:peptidoglycan/LPS O-acetylase OafA/YrhL
MEQLVARWAHNPKVTGSSPVPATEKPYNENCKAFFFLSSQPEYPLIMPDLKVKQATLEESQVSHKTKGNSMIRPLTSLRFIFALMVFLHHSKIIGLAKSRTFEDIYNAFFRGGSVGVSFFFILSGFILSYSYQKKMLQHEITKKQFWLARVARIYPLYLLTSLLSLPQYKAQILSVTYGIKFLANIFLVQTFSPNLLYLNMPGWSISAEMFFYLLFPFIISFLFRNNNKTLMYGLMLLLPVVIIVLNNTVPAHFRHFLFYISPVIRVTDFFLGICLYQIYKRIDLSKLSPAMASFLEIAALGLFAVFYMYENNIGQVYRYSAYYWLPMCFIILIFTNPVGIVSQFISRRFFVYLGELSFGFYLFHVLVAINFLAINRRVLHIEHVGVILAIIFFITLLVSWFSYEKIEKPANSFLRNKFR